MDIENVQSKLNNGLFFLGIGNDLIGSRSSGEDYEALFEKIQLLNESASSQLEQIRGWVDGLEFKSTG